MLSYQHIYHAGSFADVHKHTLLVQLLRSLVGGPLPLHVLDTHAGRGFYDLTGREAHKTGEHEFGVTPLWENRRAISDGVVRDYMSAVARYNNGTKLRRYPGSSRLTRDNIDPKDILIAAERHPGEFEQLESSFANDDPATTELIHDDGLLGLTEAAPEDGTRGLLIIDPSYEIKSEYAQLPHRLLQAWRLWPNSVGFIWYPILPAQGHLALLAGLQKAQLGTALISEVRLPVPPRPGYRMEGSGIALINGPWSVEDLAKMTDEIAAALDIEADSHTHRLEDISF